MKKLLLVLFLVVALSAATFSLASASPGLQGGGGVHYVTFGETLHSIAAKYGVTADAILRINGLANPDLIYVGQPLVIPGIQGGSGGYAPSPKSYGCPNFHTVSAGETLSGIAYGYGVSLQELLSHNYLYNSNVVFVGQKICLPTRAQRGYAPQPAGYQQEYDIPANAHYHTVRNGETLHLIAQQYGVNYLDIVRSNNLNNAGLIWAGQRLHIPGYQPAPPPVSAPSQNYSPKPDYAPPSGAPPPAPGYDASYDDVDVHPKVPADDSLPPAPEYQASPLTPLLPLAEHPLEVVVNGGVTWVGEAFSAGDDPNGITTLIVSVEEAEERGEARFVKARSGDLELKSDLGLVPEFGIDKFRAVFRHIPPGDYDVWLEDPDIPSEKVQVDLEAGKRVGVDFRQGLSFDGPTFASPTGWILLDWDNSSEPGKRVGGWSNILVRAPASGLLVNIESEGGGYKAHCLTGSKGPGACDFAGLNAGLYFIWIDGSDLTVKTYMDGNAFATFTFARQPAEIEEEKHFVGPVDYN